jgi:hypothetical protein
VVPEAALLALLCWFLVSVVITAGWILAAEVFRKMDLILGKKRLKTPEQALIDFTYMQ